MASSFSPAETIAARLSVCLGRHTAKNAVKTFCERTFSRPPVTLTRADIPALLTAMRPMLRTLTGAPQADILVAQIKGDLGL